MRRSVVPIVRLAAARRSLGLVDGESAGSGWVYSAALDRLVTPAEYEAARDYTAEAPASNLVYDAEWQRKCTSPNAPVECFTAGGAALTQAQNLAKQNVIDNQNNYDLWQATVRDWQANGGYRWVNNVWTKTSEPPPPPLYRPTDVPTVLRQFTADPSDPWSLANDPSYRIYSGSAGYSQYTGSTESGARPSGSGSGAPAAAPQFSVQLRNMTRATGGNVVGDAWQVVITGAAPNSPVTFVSTQNGTKRTTGTLGGTTDANGNYSFSDKFGADTIGNWEQVYSVAGRSAQLKFSVTAAPTQQQTSGADGKPSGPSGAAGVPAWAWYGAAGLAAVGLISFIAGGRR